MTDPENETQQNTLYDLPLGEPAEKKTEQQKEQQDRGETKEVAEVKEKQQEQQEPREQKEQKEPREGREQTNWRRDRNQDRREPRERREQREPREPREQREPKEQREVREPREPREQREVREPREPQAQREPREQRPPREQREPREQKEPRDNRDQSNGKKDRFQGRGSRPQRGNEKPQGEQQFDKQSQGGSSEISVVIPLYNEEQSLRELYDQLKDVLYRMGRYEIIFIDDGSTDGSLRVLQELRKKDSRVKIIRFRRNYGKSAALSVGFQHAHGNYIITMDADLQDDPAAIPNLINELKKGYDLVSGWKKKRYDPITKTIPSRFFNFVTSVMTDIKLHDFNCGLKAYRKEVVKEISLYGELHRYIPVLAHWQGFKIGEITVPHHPRKYGKTKFGVGRFWKGFLDLLTVLFTTRYLNRPLHLFGFWGSALAGAGFLVDAYLTYLKLVEGVPLGNRPLFLAGTLLIIVGVQFISLGLLGEMITKTRRESKEEYAIKEIWK